MWKKEEFVTGIGCKHARNTRASRWTNTLGTKGNGTTFYQRSICISLHKSLNKLLLGSRTSYYGRTSRDGQLQLISGPDEGAAHFIRQLGLALRHSQFLNFFVDVRCGEERCSKCSRRSFLDNDLWGERIAGAVYERESESERKREVC